MFQNTAPGNYDYEALVSVDDSLRHLCFDYEHHVWHRGDVLGQRVKGRPVFVQNTGPGNNNFEVIAREGDRLRHYWYTATERQWHVGETFGADVTSDPAMAQFDATGGHDYHVVVRERDRICHHLFNYERRRWEQGRQVGGEIAGAPAITLTTDGLFLIAPALDRLVAHRYRIATRVWETLGDLDFDFVEGSHPVIVSGSMRGASAVHVICRERDHLRHCWFDLGSDRWHRGDAFGAEVNGDPVMFQNHAPGNLNLELVVLQGDVITHHFFDAHTSTWNGPYVVATGFTKVHGFFQNHAPLNFNYELLVEHTHGLHHFWFSLFELRWHQGLQPVAQPFRIHAPSEPVFVSGYAPMSLTIDPTVDVNDIALVVETPNRAGSYASLATNPDTGAAELFFLAGSSPGRQRVVAHQLSSGTVLDTVEVEVTDDWPDRALAGPPIWLGMHQHGTMGGSVWGSPHDTPTKTGDVKPVSGDINMAVLFLDSSDRRYTLQEVTDATTRWTNAANSTTDWSASQYWPEVSYGKVTSFTATAIKGPFALANGWNSYYHDWLDETTGAYKSSEHKGNLLQTVVTAAQAAIDFDDIDIVVCVSRNPDANRHTWPKAQSDVAIKYRNSQGVDMNKNVGLVSMPFNWGQSEATAQARHRKLASTLIHETGHTLRLGDVYSWSGHPEHIRDRALGGWDLMANQSGMPHTVATWRHQLGWINAITEVLRFNFAKTGRTAVTVDLYPIERQNLPAGGYRAIEIAVDDGWSLFLEYRRAQAGQIGDHQLPTPGAVLITDVVRIKDWDAMQRRKPILLGYEDAQGDGPALVAGDEWRVLDQQQLPAEFAAKVVTATAEKATVRISYGENSRPDPSLEPWDTKTWQSPSIEVRNERTRHDPKWRNTPLLGGQNDLVATVANNSNVAAPGVTVRFAIKDFNLGSGSFYPVSTPVTSDVPAAGTKEFELKDGWVPGIKGHYCIQAEIDVYAIPGPITELTGLNNRAQSNYARFVSKTASPVTRERTTVTVENPFSEPTSVSLHAVQSSPLYRTLVSTRSLILRPREVREIEVLVEYGSDETERTISEDFREAFIGEPNDVSVWATARQPLEESSPDILLGGVALQVATGRATRFDSFIHDAPSILGRVVAEDDESAVPGGFVIVTTAAASGRMSTVSSSVSADGRFGVPTPPNAVRAWADYVPADGYGDCRHNVIPLRS